MDRGEHLIHRLGHFDPGLRERVGVVEQDLRVRVERQCVIAALDHGGAHGAGKKLACHIIKIPHLLIQRDKDVHFLELRNPRDVQTRHIGQGVRACADKDLVVQVGPLVRDGVDLVAGVFFLKFGDQHIHQSLILCGLRAVVMPEVDRNGFFGRGCGRFCRLVIGGNGRVACGLLGLGSVWRFFGACSECR